MPNAHGVSKRQPAYTDLDRMSFGQYKGECFQDIPASYLKWLYDEMKEVYQHALWTTKEV